jgi:hypothetical protein
MRRVEDGSRLGGRDDSRGGRVDIGHQHTGDAYLGYSERIWFFYQTSIWKHQIDGQLCIAQMFVVDVQ